VKKKIILVSLFIISVIIVNYYFPFFNNIKKLSTNSTALQNFSKGNFLKEKSLNFLISNSEDKYSIMPYSFRINDFTNLKKEYLFENIESSINVSKERIQNGLFTEEQFLNYILPYRLNYERLEDWRTLAIEKYNSCFDADIFKHVKNINDDLKEIFEYTGSSFPNRKLSKLFDNCKGGCYEMSDIAAFTMRANGIPIAIDFAKWSTIRGRHQWNALILKDKSSPFLGIESDPGPKIDAEGNETEPETFKIFSDYKRFAKVYRKSFLKYEKFETEFNPKKVISDVNYIDVTKEYCKNSKDIKLEFSNELIENDLIYLCIYEANSWSPVDYAYYKNNTLLFKDVCVDNVFTLKKRVKDKFEYFKTPFTFNQQGEIEFKNPDSTESKNIKLQFFNSKEREIMKLFNQNLDYSEVVKIKDQILESNITGFIQKDSTYNLFIWNKKWVKIAQSIGEDGFINFNNIPNNGLYKLEDINDPSAFKNRCFTIDSDLVQNWWSPILY
jgi:hypothetical protein